jgi:hypothetical protein
MLAFMSYQTQDRQMAAQVAALLMKFGVKSFMAHEHIEVSVEWRSEILQRLGLADLFVALLSDRYYQSTWCVQELGIACFRGLTILPLSIDGAIPRGFAAHIQSSFIEGGGPTLRNVIPGLAKHDVVMVINVLIERVAGSRSFRSAEANFALLVPYLPRATDDQVARLLHHSVDNDQVCNASLCAIEYLPPLLAKHGGLMVPEERERLARILDYYANQSQLRPQ